MNIVNIAAPESDTDTIELGVVRVAGGLSCSCGRPQQPYDFTIGADDIVRAICARCHRTTVEIELW